MNKLGVARIDNLRDRNDEIIKKKSSSQAEALHRKRPTPAMGRIAFMDRFRGSQSCTKTTLLKCVHGVSRPKCRHVGPLSRGYEPRKKSAYAAVTG